MDSSLPLQALLENTRDGSRFGESRLMASGTPGILQRDLNTLFESGSLTGLTDRDLVERVSGPPDAKAEAAFEALVTRHGPMVLRVCRNVLGHLEDAEDAFQATFLVLVKQRGSIRKLDSVASSLYGVAARVAARARVDGARRRKSEQGRIRLVADSATTADTPTKISIKPFMARSSRRRSAGCRRNTGPWSCSATGRA